jgi:hypothetical protein
VLTYKATLAEISLNDPFASIPLITLPYLRKGLFLGVFNVQKLINFYFFYNIFYNIFQHLQT